jgi:propanol-preferring alcohol dehydrogenase
MKAVVLYDQKPLEERPLRIVNNYPDPQPGDHEIRLAISLCGACRTDLHIIEGELPAHKMPVIVGHQIIGRVDKTGANVSVWKIGDRVGIPWLYRTCGACKFCKRNMENICDNALFTGYDADGGLAEYITIREDYAYQLPPDYNDEEATPLLCAGVIGYQAFQATGLIDRGKLGLFGFGSSAHIIIQVAIHLGHEVYVVSRTDRELELAKKLGARWVGHSNDKMGTLLDAGIVFAPSGDLIVNALSRLDKGGRLVSAGIYASPLPGFDYSALWPEKSIIAIANTSRQSVRAFMNIASQLKIRASTTVYPLEDIHEALLNIKYSRISGSTIFRIK